MCRLIELFELNLHNSIWVSLKLEYLNCGFLITEFDVFSPS